MMPKIMIGIAGTPVTSVRRMCDRERGKLLGNSLVTSFEEQGQIYVEWSTPERL